MSCPRRRRIPNRLSAFLWRVCSQGAPLREEADVEPFGAIDQAVNGGARQPTALPPGVAQKKLCDALFPGEGEDGVNEVRALQTVDFGPHVPCQGEVLFEQFAV